jgi:hypothetical protein
MFLWGFIGVCFAGQTKSRNILSECTDISGLEISWTLMAYLLTKEF